MRRLHGSYASWFNVRHELAGHVFQGRYGSTRVLDEIHLITTVRYVESNPVVAGLAPTAEAWPWSGRGAPAPPRWLATERLRQLIGL
jgi:REP element-mobilizing transposase RayT